MMQTMLKRSAYLYFCPFVPPGHVADVNISAGCKTSFSANSVFPQLLTPFLAFSEPHNEHEQYTQEMLLPVGVGADPPADGEPPSEDVIAPAYPKYEGLAYKSAAHLPDEAEDLQFPPASAARPAAVASLLAVA